MHKRPRFFAYSLLVIFSFFSVITILMDAKSLLFVVLICIFLIISDFEHHFMCLLVISLSLKNIYSGQWCGLFVLVMSLPSEAVLRGKGALWRPKLRVRGCVLWSSWVPYTVWIFTPCQTWDLQIFFPFCKWPAHLFLQYLLTFPLCTPIISPQLLKEAVLVLCSSMNCS